MFGALRYSDSTSDPEFVKLSKESGVDARGYTLVVSLRPPFSARSGDPASWRVTIAELERFGPPIPPAAFAWRSARWPSTNLGQFMRSEYQLKCSGHKDCCERCQANSYTCTYSMSSGVSKKRGRRQAANGATTNGNSERSAGSGANSNNRRSRQRQEQPTSGRQDTRPSGDAQAAKASATDRQPDTTTTSAMPGRTTTRSGSGHLSNDSSLGDSSLETITSCPSPSTSILGLTTNFDGVEFDPFSLAGVDFESGDMAAFDLAVGNNNSNGDELHAIYSNGSGGGISPLSHPNNNISSYSPIMRNFMMANSKAAKGPPPPPPPPALLTIPHGMNHSAGPDFMDIESPPSCSSQERHHTAAAPAAQQQQQQQCSQSTAPASSAGSSSGDGGSSCQCVGSLARALENIGGLATCPHGREIDTLLTCLGIGMETCRSVLACSRCTTYRDSSMLVATVTRQLSSILSDACRYLSERGADSISSSSASSGGSGGDKLQQLAVVAEPSEGLVISVGRYRIDNTRIRLKIVQNLVILHIKELRALVNQIKERGGQKMVASTMVLDAEEQVHKAWMMQCLMGD